MYTYFRTKDDLVAAYLQRRSDAWQSHVADQLHARGGSPENKALLVFDLLGEWFESDYFRGCPFVNAEAESSPDSPGHSVNLGHRTAHGYESSSANFSARSELPARMTC